MRTNEYSSCPSERTNILAAECLQQLAKRIINLDIPFKHAKTLSQNTGLKKTLKLLLKRRQLKRTGKHKPLSKKDQDFFLFYEVVLQSTAYKEGKNDESKIGQKKIEREIKRKTITFANEKIRGVIDEIKKRDKERYEESKFIDELSKLSRAVDYSFHSLRHFLIKINRLYRLRKIEAYKKIEDTAKIEIAIQELDKLFLIYLIKIKEIKEFC